MGRGALPCLLLAAPVVVVAGLAALAGCQPHPGPRVVTYAADVQPILQRRCVHCHAAGLMAPFPLTSYEQAARAAPDIVSTTAAGLMPPYPASTACRSYLDDRHLDGAELAALRGWLEAGTPAGDEVGAPSSSAHGLTAAPRDDLGEPTDVWGIGDADPAGYVPASGAVDDDRCFPLPLAFPADRYLRAFGVVADRQDAVHHASLYRVDAALSPAVDALDLASDGVGYPCFDGPGTTSAELLGGGGGMDRVTLPDDTALRVARGSRLVLQLHYEGATASGRADRSAVELWLADAPPAQLVRTEVLAVDDLRVAPGDPHAVHAQTFTNASGAPWRVVGDTPQMHQRGARITATVVHADGGEDCLVDVPRWDFHWRQRYMFWGPPVVVLPGEAVRVTCVHDNSAAHQPRAGQAPPPLVRGAGVDDEVCQNSLALLQDLAPAP